MSERLLVVGRVLTGDPQRPTSGAVAFVGGRVAEIGDAAGLRDRRSPGARILETGPGVVLPGFVDAHLHFLALARRSVEVDCSRDACGSNEALLAALRQAAAGKPPGEWIRAYGWDASLLDEPRSPTLAEIDAILPHHPLRLLHRTGRVALLSSVAFERLGLGAAPEVERDASGRPTGRVYEPGPLLRGRLPRLDEATLDGLCEAASRRLLAAGVTSFHDPTPGQGMAELARFRRLASSGRLRQRVRLYGGEELLDDDGESAAVRVAGAKVVVHSNADPEEIARAVAAFDRRGAAVALHAVEPEELAIALEALRRIGPKRVRARRHRIEHVSLCPPPLAAGIGASGAAVVTHPEFLVRFVAKYRREVAPELQPWLYPLRTLVDSGAPVALGSDAPIVAPTPLAAIAAAVDRGPTRLGGDEALTAGEALRAHTVGAAALAGDEGRLVPGARGDAVVLGADPREVPASEIATIPICATIVGGEVVWVA